MKSGRLRFGHSEAAIRFWRQLVRRALRTTPTPFYIFSAEPLSSALLELAVLQRNLPIPCRSWLSCKTQPVRPLLAWWQRQGLGIEVVSEFELLAALREGFTPDLILVNGPGKQRWLGRHRVEGLRVNFDSPGEVKALLPLALELRWSVGVRCQTSIEVDPDPPQDPAQFGMPAEEVVPLLRRLQRAKVRLETVHFHLRTNVPSPAVYAAALAEVAAICRAAEFQPRHLDCGGGFPVPCVLSREGRAYDTDFELQKMGRVYAQALSQFSGLRELWLENGRFLSARTGVLVIQIVDVKVRGKVRQLICDGGRTMNALISQWEEHEILPFPGRRGSPCLTSICGPTCMAFDRLTCRSLPANLRPGDYLIWMDAGAYHVSWETRFSHGAAGVVWHQNDVLTLVREPESFERWWGQWGPTTG